MDPFTSWYQTDNDGPAKLLWLRIWQTQQELENMKVQENTIENNCDIEQQQFTNGFFNQQQQQQQISINTIMFNGKTGQDKTNNTRRIKSDQRLTNKRPMGHNNRPCPNYGGCPWRQDKFPYSKGIIG